MTKPDLGETDKFKAMLQRVGQPSTRNSNSPYLVAVVVSLLIAVGGSATIIFLRPDYDPLIIIVTILTAVGAVTTQILQFMKLTEVEKKTEVAVIQGDATHTMMNSKLTEAIAKAEKAGFDAGLQAGQDKANQRTDELKRAADVSPAESE